MTVKRCRLRLDMTVKREAIRYRTAAEVRRPYCPMGIQGSEPSTNRSGQSSTTNKKAGFNEERRHIDQEFVRTQPFVLVQVQGQGGSVAQVSAIRFLLDAAVRSHTAGQQQALIANAVVDPTAEGTQGVLLLVGYQEGAGVLPPVTDAV
ncbi:hypothetical protein RvY_18088 [Ramazzottius varieornatus]|uniref:Uncharacterized protein n=1 Tax=Ramazzottius varieornatus TaxID=947166 RepID=A0A1D1W4H9_RAMVA|nr:hypothetical protein RvY_18088 [Ramazzottius varieornatus]